MNRILQEDVSAWFEESGFSSYSLGDTGERSLTNTLNKHCVPRPKDKGKNELQLGTWVEYLGECYEIEQLCFSASGWTFDGNGDGNGISVAPVSDCTVCPNDANGIPILIGETVYSAQGEARKVTGYNGTFFTYDDAPENSLGGIPDLHTHKQPDSWIKLAADAEKDATVYCNERDLENSNGWKKTMTRDLITRAKRLAGVADE